MSYETFSCDSNQKRARLIGTIFSNLAAGYSQMGCYFTKWQRPSNTHIVNCDWILHDFEERQVSKLFKTLFYIMLHIFEFINITLGLLGLVFRRIMVIFIAPTEIWQLSVDHFGAWIHKYHGENRTFSGNLKTNTAAGFCFCIGESVEKQETPAKRQEDY